MAQVQCQQCGAMTEGEGATCQSCGAPLGGAPAAPAPSPFPTPIVGGSTPTQQPMGYARAADAPAAQMAPQAQPMPAPPAAAPAPTPATPPASQLPPTQSPPPAAPPPGQAPAPAPPPPTSPFYYGSPAGSLSPGQQMAKDVAGLRFVALFLDFVLIGIVQGVISAVLIFSPFFFAPAIITSGIAFLYFALLEGTQGQTFGKMALGLKVVKEDMTPIQLEQALIRAADLFLWGLTFGIVALIDLIFVLDNGQRLGDRMAHTLVIKVQ